MNLLDRPIRRFEQLWPRGALSMRARLERHRGEPDLALAVELAATCRTSIDVGANRGVYAFWMANRAQRCIAFEPNPECVELLERALGSQIEVHRVALSDRLGRATLTIPTIGGRENSYRSSLESSDSASSRTVCVETASLDSFQLDDVDFIKIDVEGHETEVLDGAAQTLARHRPTVLVEAEERHRSGSVQGVHQRFRELGYQGFFIYEDRIVDIDRFTLAEHQIEPDAMGVRSATYVNNFLFVHTGATKHLEIVETHR